MVQRTKLVDILNEQGEGFRQKWESTAPATELSALPAGEYLCRTLAGELFQSKNGTPGYKISLEIIEGEHQGRRCWIDFWLSSASRSR